MTGGRPAAAGYDLTYRRGALSVALRGVPGRTLFSADEAEQFQTRFSAHDWLIAPADLILDDVETLPQAGDTIEQTDGEKLNTFEVLPVGRDRPHPQSSHQTHRDRGRPMITALRDAIAAALNEADLGQTFAAAAEWAPSDRIDNQALRVLVVHAETTFTRSDRGGRYRDHTFHIGIQKKLTDTNTANVDPLVDLLEAVDADHETNQQRTSVFLWDSSDPNEIGLLDGRKQPIDSDGTDRGANQRMDVLRHQHERDETKLLLRNGPVD